MTLEEYLYYRSLVVNHDENAFQRVQNKRPPTDPMDFALRVSFVIVNSGMRSTVATSIWERLRPSLVETGEVGETFGHPGKRISINRIMVDREVLFSECQAAWNEGPDEVIGFCETIPHIGKITRFHLAKNLGVDCAKPDVWLERVAKRSNEDVHGLCARLSEQSGDKVSVVDFVIWRACQQGWWNC